MAVKDNPATEGSLKDTITELQSVNEKLAKGFEIEQVVSEKVEKTNKELTKLPTIFSTMVKEMGFAPDGIGGTEKDREEERRAKLQLSTFGKILNTLENMDESLEKMVKSMTQETLGGIIGLIAAPIIAVVAFFNQLRKEWQALKMLAAWFRKTRIGRTLALFMKPFQLLYDFTIGRVFKAFGNNIRAFKTGFTNIGKTMGGVGKAIDVKEFKTIGGRLGARLGQLNNWFKSLIKIKDWPKLDLIKKVTKPFKDLAFGFREVGNMGKVFGTFGKPAQIKNFTGFWKKVGAVFGSISKFVAASKVFATIGRIAGSIGRILGKVFFPITIIMGIFDFVTGFMKGKEEGGILEGFKQGTIKLIDGLIAMPLDFLKDGLAWILKQFGFDEESEALKSFSFSKLFSDMIGGIFDAIQATIDWVKLLFSDPTAALKKLWTGLLGGFSSLIDILYWPVNAFIRWIMKKFEWDTPDFTKNAEGEFSIGSIVTNLIQGIVNMIKKALRSFGLGFLLGEGKDEKMKELQEKIVSMEKDVATDSWHESRGERKRDVEELAQLRREMADLKAEQRQGGQIVSAPIQANTKVGGDTTHVGTTSNRHPVMVGG